MESSLKDISIVLQEFGMPDRMETVLPGHYDAYIRFCYGHFAIAYKSDPHQDWKLQQINEAVNMWASKRWDKSAKGLKDKIKKDFLECKHNFYFTRYNELIDLMKKWDRTFTG